jgi:hypothetical protein
MTDTRLEHDDTTSHLEEFSPDERAELRARNAKIELTLPETGPYSKVGTDGLCKIVKDRIEAVNSLSILLS